MNRPWFPFDVVELKVYPGFRKLLQRGHQVSWLPPYEYRIMYMVDKRTQRGDMNGRLGPQGFCYVAPLP